MLWLGYNSYNPDNYGWKIKNRSLIPKSTDRLPAPENLLKVIACNCSGDCSSLQCGCRKGGYSCTCLCGQCQLKDCTNVDIIFEPEDMDADLEMSE